MAVSKLSLCPLAIFVLVLALAGATRNRSPQRPSSTWLFHSPVSGTEYSTNTGFLESVESVSGVIKLEASGVIATFTSAPALTSRRTKISVSYTHIRAHETRHE